MSKYAALVAAARKLAKTEVAWWRDASPEGERASLDDTLDVLEKSPPKKIEALIDYAKAPWHFAALARAIPSKTKADASPGSKALWVDGSLHLSGALKLKGALVVTGDLTIDGPLIDIIEQWHLLVVGGTLKADAIASSQSIFVGGDCIVNELVWGFEMHNTFAVRGALETPVFVITDHRPHAIGNAKGVKASLINPTSEQLLKHFDPAVVGNDTLKPKAIQMRLGSNKPVLAR